MKKSGGLSLPAYIAYFVIGLVMAVVEYNRAQTAEQFEPLGHAFAMIIFGIIAAIGLVAVILKLVHMATGWGIFSFICILFDVAAVVASLYIFIINTASADFTGLVWLVVVFILAVASAVSNILSTFRR